ncbi:DUF4393 domain-containing protein [Endozoicomonas sp. G2_2]|uniref:Abi-alpha family protein n=1 Tax=Endozoicomonas sp. G2_2 TaxID=2821092 RepID=UPI001AD9BFAA|nr:Abi-alpha family protein [Endozoicomonas sp. G2_2]MBO9470025.1 DUF4393 domain-containing protein [Endozoicomonas sp. G2_2]
MRHLPGADRLEARARGVERLVLRALELRLARIRVDQAALSDNSASSSGHGAAGCGARIETLMAESLDQRPEHAERALYDQLISQIVPDEMRIVAALSDGSRLAACHVDVVSPLGGSRTRVLSHASRAGTQAGVMLDEHTPYYLAHLERLGLLETGPEDSAHAETYELIENDSAVRRLCTEVESASRRKPKLTRHTLRLSALGHQLWAQREERGEGAAS